MCPPERDERRNRSPTIFIFEGSDGEGTDAHPLWGARARFWAGRADGPSQGSTHPLAPSKTKVAAERCCSGAEVWTCPPDRNERRNRSPTIFIFEGSDGEGTDAHPLWGPRALYGQAARTALLRARLNRSLPRKRKSRQSAAVLGPRCGRVPQTGTSDGITPRRFSFSRGRTGKGLTLTRSGALVHVSGQAARTALLRARLNRSLPRKRKSRQSAAVLGPRCGRVPQTGTSDGIAPRRFSFSRGRTGKGLTLTRSGALVHVSGQAARTALLRARLTRSLPRKRKSRQSAAVLGPRCGRVPQTGTSDGIAPRRFSFSRGRTGKGLMLTRSGALVHISGQAARTALLRARLTRSLPRKRKSRQSAAVLGPRCGRVPLTGTSDGIAPRRFSFSRGRTGKGLTLTRSGALVHVSGQAARTALLRARLNRSLPRKRKSRQSAAVLGPRCGRVPQTGTSDGIAPRRFSFSRGRTGKGLMLTRSGALVHVYGQAARTALLRARLTRSLPRKRKSRQSAAVLGPRCGRVPQTGTSDGIAPRRFSFSRGQTGKGLTLTRSGALVHVYGQAARTALLRVRLARSLPRKRKSRQSAAVLGPRCGRVPQTGTSDGIAPRRFSFSRGRTGKGLTLNRSGALVHVSGQAARTALLRARLTRSLPRKRKSRQSAAVLGPRCGRVPQPGTSDSIPPRRFSFSRGKG